MEPVTKTVSNEASICVRSMAYTENEIAFVEQVALFPLLTNDITIFKLDKFVSQTSPSIGVRAATRSCHGVAGSPSGDTFLREGRVMFGTSGNISTHTRGHAAQSLPWHVPVQHTMVVLVIVCGARNRLAAANSSRKRHAVGDIDHVWGIGHQRRHGMA